MKVYEFGVDEGMFVDVEIVVKLFFELMIKYVMVC